ncbi:hypothetical protein IFR05_007986 [Cadophora sp. M221]|nr:hypothetical protein IFR05_007986 [Cadophora sp. M221]
MTSGSSPETPQKDAAMDSTNRRETQARQEEDILDIWEKATINRSVTPTPSDTPNSDISGVSMTESDISDGIGLDVSLDSNLFDDKWMPFGPSGIYGFILPSFDEEQLAENLETNIQLWDDVPNFDEPFAFGASLFMDVDGTLPAANPHVAEMAPAVQSTPTRDTVSSTSLTASSFCQYPIIRRKAAHNGFLGHQEGFNIPFRRQHRMPQSLSYAEQSLADSLEIPGGRSADPSSMTTPQTQQARFIEDNDLAASPADNVLLSKQRLSYEVVFSNGQDAEVPLEETPLPQVPSAVQSKVIPTQSTRQLSLPLFDEKSTTNRTPSDHGECSSSKSRSTTLSSFTEDESDWGEDDSTSSVQDMHFPGFSAFAKQDVLSPDQVKQSLTRPVFSPMKQELIDRIMNEFWVIFNQDSEATQNSSPATNSIEPTETERGSSFVAGESSQNVEPDTVVNSIDMSQKSTRSTLGRRKREDDDDQDSNSKEGRNPKRPRMLLSPPRNADDSTKFACPYRKRDARKYCVKYWKACALTPQDTVARVKGHLYRHHRIFPCQRCKALFKDQDAVNLHLMEQDVCERRDVEHADGVTTEIFEKLRSKKKTQRDQTEADRWKDIYKLLFPNEMIPSPYFEEVQEDNIILSPDSRELADYEEYCRRELPRRVRAALEEIVNTESQPMEESIRNQLMSIIRDCQDRVFSSYRSSSAVAFSVGSVLPASEDASASELPTISSGESMAMVSQPKEAIIERTFASTAPPFFRPPPPQIHLRSGLEVSDLQGNITSRAPAGSDPSDSGYSSAESGDLSRAPSFNPTNDNSSLPNSESDMFFSVKADANDQGNWDIGSRINMNEYSSSPVNPNDAGALDQLWLDFNSQAAHCHAKDPYLSNLELDYDFPANRTL